MLNSASAIKIRFDDHHRRVELLRGEAWFKVHHDPAAPFQVSAKTGQTEDIGTAFAVDEEGNDVTVTVTEGKVRVGNRVALTEGAPGYEEQNVEVKENEQTNYEPGNAPLPPIKVDSQAAVAWTRGRVIIEGQPFAKAISQLSRYVRELVVFSEAAQQAPTVSGIFTTGNALEAMNALAETQHLSMTRIPGLVIFIR